jgi:hypothetical protein
MRSVSENMRAVLDRLEQLTESLMAIPDVLYEAVDNLEADQRGTLQEGDYLLCYETLTDDMSDVLSGWREANPNAMLVDSGDRWAIFKNQAQ